MRSTAALEGSCAAVPALGHVPRPGPDERVHGRACGCEACVENTAREDEAIERLLGVYSSRQAVRDVLPPPSLDDAPWRLRRRDHHPVSYALTRRGGETWIPS